MREQITQRKQFFPRKCGTTTDQAKKLKNAKKAQIVLVEATIRCRILADREAGPYNKGTKQTTSVIYARRFSPRAAYAARYARSGRKSASNYAKRTEGR